MKTYNSLFADECELLTGQARREAQRVIRESHYTHSVPSGKSYYIRYREAIVVFSISANPYAAKFLLGREAEVWELSRLWAPDGHEKNLLTMALSECLSEWRKYQPKVEALLSYADQNVGHEGFVYRAASWKFIGESDERRCYRGADGQIVPRRKFHSGKGFSTKEEIHSRGFEETKLKGKLRFAKGLTIKARKEIDRRFPEHSKPRQ